MTHIPEFNSIARSPATVWARTTHILELDGLRGLAILMVTVYRFGREIPADTFLGSILHQTIALGDRGVDLFFVLSGFLITGVLLDTRGDDHYLRNFFARRTLRIFPLYFVSLFLFLVLIPYIWPASHPFQMAREQQFYLWTYLANVRMAVLGEWCFGSLDHFWSLAVEEHFYLLWPFCILLLGLRRALWFSLGAAAVCALSRVAFARLSENGIAPDVMSLFRFDGLLVGAAIATIVRSEGGFAVLRRCALVLLPLTAGVCIALAVGMGRLLTIPHSLWAILWGSFLIVLLSSGATSGTARVFRWGWLRSLGRYSYAMYIFQSPLIPLMAGFWSASSIAAYLNWSPDRLVPAHLIYIATMFAVTFGIALLSWHLLEKHCLKLKRFVASTPRPQPDARVDDGFELDPPRRDDPPVYAATLSH